VRRRSQVVRQGSAKARYGSSNLPVASKFAMRIGIVGGGAIGGFLAAALARAGFSVGVVARGPHLNAIRRNGLRVESDLGAFVARVDASDALGELGDFDALLLTFKAHHWPAFLAQLEPFAATRTTIVTMQNGVPFWYLREPPLRSVDPGGRIARLFGDDRVVGGVVHVSGAVVEPGVIRQSGGLRYLLGDALAGGALAAPLVELLRKAGLKAEADRDIRASVWLKLVNNAGLNPVSVLRRTTIKPMLSNAASRLEVRQLMSEALQVGQAIGVVSSVDIEARIEYAARLDDVKTSMLQDYERERALELDPILGAVIEIADRWGVGVPALRAAYAALQPAAAKAVEH
jgi:2-dehydropantoate 2-reductase